MRLQVQQPAAQQPADAEEAAHQFSTEQRTATLDAASNYVAADQMDTTAIDAVVLQTARGVNSAHLVVVMPCHGGIGGAVSELNVLVVPHRSASQYPIHPPSRQPQPLRQKACSRPPGVC